MQTDILGILFQCLGDRIYSVIRRNENCFCLLLCILFGLALIYRQCSILFILYLNINRVFLITPICSINIIKSCFFSFYFHFLIYILLLVFTDFRLSGNFFFQNTSYLAVLNMILFCIKKHFRAICQISFLSFEHNSSSFSFFSS